MRPSISFDETPPPSPLGTPSREARNFMTPRAAYLSRKIDVHLTDRDSSRPYTPRTQYLRHLASGFTGGLRRLSVALSPKRSAPARIRTFPRMGSLDPESNYEREDSEVWGSPINRGGGGSEGTAVTSVLKLLFIALCAAVVLGGGRLLGVAMRERGSGSLAARRRPHSNLGDDSFGLFRAQRPVKRTKALRAAPAPRPAPTAEIAVPPLLDTSPSDTTTAAITVEAHNELASKSALATSEMAKVSCTTLDAQLPAFPACSLYCCGLQIIAFHAPAHK